MATIAENLTLLKSTKAGIKAAIEAKGVSNVGDKFSDYPAKIASIPTGGSTSGVSQWTGTVDRAGLTELGWSTTDIDNFQANVRWYDWQNPDYTVVDADKSITDISQYNGNKNVRYAKMLDTSQVTDMSTMFSSCTSLTTIPALDTSKVTNMSTMFKGCSRLTSIPALDTSQVTNMSGMFWGCTNLTSIPTLDTSKVIYIGSMFYGCSRLTSIPTLDTSKVTDTAYMFFGCTNLTSIPTLDTSQATNMSSMFYDCSSLTSIPTLDTSQVTNMYSMFYRCTSLTSIPALDTSKVTKMESMFSNCASLISIPALDTSQVTDMSTMFSRCTSLTTIESIDFSSCTNTGNMFPSYYDYSKLTSMHVTGSISFSWTSNGFSSIPNLDFNSIKSILEAMNRCTNPETAKTMSFKATMTDQDSQLTNLVSECNGKGWTITGLTIN